MLTSIQRPASWRARALWASVLCTGLSATWYVVRPLNSCSRRNRDLIAWLLAVSRVRGRLSRIHRVLPQPFRLRGGLPRAGLSPAHVALPDDVCRPECHSLLWKRQCYGLVDDHNELPLIPNEEADRNPTVMANYLIAISGHEGTNWQIKGTALACYSLATLSKCRPSLNNHE